MAPEAHWAQVYPDLHLGSYKVTQPGAPSNVCLIKFLQKCTPEAPEPHRAPILALLDPGVRVGGVQPHQIAIRNIYFNLAFINSHS